MDKTKLQMMEEQPLISCICITRNRPLLLKRAIACFLSQTYMNKELVVLVEENDKKTLVAVTPFLSAQIRLIKIKKSPELHLGGLRNKAIAAAVGTYICQWDDDDWYHPERLQYQFNLLVKSGYDACVLGYFLIFDTTTGISYRSCFRLWEGSLLCKTDIALAYPYANLKRGEDTPVIKTLQRKRLLFTDPAITHYYHYVFHGNNTWDYNHFCKFFPYCKALPDAFSKCVSQILSDEKTDDDKVVSLNRQFKNIV